MKNDRAKRDLRDIAVAAREAWPQLSFEDDAFLEFLRAQPLRLALAAFMWALALSGVQRLTARMRAPRSTPEQGW
jgi:hypothetical protein